MVSCLLAWRVMRLLSLVTDPALLGARSVFPLPRVVRGADLLLDPSLAA